MGNSFWLSWEPGFIVFLQSKVTPVIQKIFEGLTFFGDVYALIIIIGFLYWGYKKELGKKIGIYAVGALVVSISLNNIIKRRRPYFDHSDIKCLKPRSNEGDIYDPVVQGYSFPSGHAIDSISTYGVLGVNTKNKLLRTLLFIFIVLIGLSRSVLGVHYPTDVLAGWLISSLTIYIISKIKNINVVYAIILTLGVIGCFFNRSTDYFSTLGIAFGFIAGFIYEEKYINFKNTKNVFRMILRTIGGLIVFVVLDTALKLPFSETFLASNTMAAFLIRSLRYAVVSFVLIGVYPRLFCFIDNKIKERNTKNK